MGAEDLFHKRKARTHAQLQRKKQDRTPGQRYLIVCEGTKTEPHYLRELLVDFKIRPQMVRVAPNNGASPDRVVAHAHELYSEDAITGDYYDRVYCVFDRDTHTTFDAAVDHAHTLSTKKTSFVPITSTPCFEFWLLLHFGYTDQPFHARGNKSVGEAVISTLKTKEGFKGYSKGQKGIYSRLKPKLHSALTYAARLRRNNEATGSTNPATSMDALIKDLMALTT